MHPLVARTSQSGIVVFTVDVRSVDQQIDTVQQVRFFRPAELFQREAGKTDNADLPVICPDQLQKTAQSLPVLLERFSAGKGDAFDLSS